jgi:long-chain acyl-CoA synthetase
MAREVQSIPFLIEQSLVKGRNKPLFSHKKGYRTYSITGSELLSKVNKIRVLFSKNNIRKGDAIILLGSDHLEWIPVYFAAILSGVIAVPLDTLTDKTLLRKIQQQTNAKAIFQDKGLATTSSRIFYLDELDEKTEHLPSIPLTSIDAQPNDILEIMYTSGTTGEPKGVILTHENVLAGLNETINSVPLRLPFKYLVLLPLSHIFGQIQGLFLPLVYSYQAYFMDTIRPRKIVFFIKNKRINVMITVPGILASLRKELDGKSIPFKLGMQFRLIGVGGASLDPAVERWWKRRCVQVVQGYGLTETASTIAINNPFWTKTGSVGKLCKGVELQFGDDDEILVRGKNVTSGYYKNPQKTKDSFEYGWFKTGDVGELKHGYLYLKERKKDIIVTESGLKAYPIDIEEVLDNISGVKESCVLEKDKQIHAVLLLNRDLTPADIIQKANAKLLAHQKIADYSIWPEPDFPRTQTGKVKKFVVKEYLAKTQKMRFSYDSILYQIINVALRPNKKILPQTKLADLGMDSLRRIQLIAEIEKEFGVEVDEVKLTQYTTVADFETLIKEQRVRRAYLNTFSFSSLLKPFKFLLQRLFFYPLARFFTKTTYEGFQYVESLRTPCIFAANHESSWDPLIITKHFKQKVAAAAGSEFIFGIGKMSTWKRIYRRVIGVFAQTFYDSYPFGASIGTDTSLEFTGELIDRGYSIVIFPEGTRTTTGEMNAFKQGIGYLAVSMDVPIVPVRIRGLFRILPVRRFFPRFGPSTITFGKPFMVNDMSYVAATKLIEKKVREL